MEKLKLAVPDTLKRMIGESTSSDLPRTCSSLLEFLLHFQPFQLMVEDLTARSLCGKNKDAALQLKHKGNQCLLSGDCANALASYSQALRVAPVDADDTDKNLVATLYMNRASVLHKMNLLKECVRDCNCALQISPSYAKAWYRRGRANASMGNYDDAIHDLNVAKIVELSSNGKRQIESELKTILDQYNSTITSPAQHTEDKFNILDESHQIKLQCVTTPDKARGMASIYDIPPASVVHTEEPFAVIILKQCRDTHCHYCFNELPANEVPCTACSIPLYCSPQCQLQAGGKIFQNNSKNHGIHENLSNNLVKHVAEVTLVADSEIDTEHIPEHKHECQGVHWPAILPSEIVLAGRVLVKSLIGMRGSLDITNLGQTLELSYHYSQMSPESKLELHIYSSVLLFCLQHVNGFELQINGFSIAQVVIFVSQIRVNSMTIVRMKSIDVLGVNEFGKLSSGALTSNVEQVKVGQAIYKTGSLFNHSCQPNIHAYFLSRTLFIRTTQLVAAGCPLELSYGPQVGQWDCKDRIRFLEDEYSFQCQCYGCSKVNLSDLVINAFHCAKPNCSGIVLDNCVLNCEKQKIKHSPSITSTRSVGTHLQDNLNNDAIHKVAQDAFVNNLTSVNPGYCLKCGSYCDLETSFAAVNKAWKYIRRLQDAIVSEDISTTTLSDASRSLHLLRSTLHAHNKSIAEAEDSLAQAFCLVGDLRSAMEHCKASIEILENLYNPNHIVIGYELVKLSSIQLTLGESAALDSISRLDGIFSCYYGSQADSIFPYLKFLKKQDCLKGKAI